MTVPDWLVWEIEQLRLDIQKMQSRRTDLMNVLDELEKVKR